jgi:hypothetical protein
MSKDETLADSIYPWPNRLQTFEGNEAIAIEPVEQLRSDAPGEPFPNERYTAIDHQSLVAGDRTRNESLEFVDLRLMLVSQPAQIRAFDGFEALEIVLGFWHKHHTKQSSLAGLKMQRERQDPSQWAGSVMIQ